LDSVRRRNHSQRMNPARADQTIAFFWQPDFPVLFVDCCLDAPCSDLSRSKETGNASPDHADFCQLGTFQTRFLEETNKVGF
jgi:hypothetical protein